MPSTTFWTTAVLLTSSACQGLQPTMSSKVALKTLADASGDDIRGIAQADAPVPLLPDSAFWIGAAFRQWLGSSDGDIAVGYDPRTSSEEISTAFCKGARGSNAGLATTPAMLESLLGAPSETIGAVMVTASHLPAQWNGLKLFSRDLGRGLNKREVGEVMAIAVDIADDNSPAAMAQVEVPQLSNFMNRYIIKLQNTIRNTAGKPDTRRRDVSEFDMDDMELELMDDPVMKFTYPLLGMRIAVNPGNGAGGFFASEVLAPLGADVSPSLNLEPDGTFPSHLPNPEDKMHVQVTSEAVARSGADVGVMLDTDVDRCGLIDGCCYPNPEPVNRNRLVALCASVALEAAENEEPPKVIVTDPVTSQGMASFIAQRGGQHDRFKMGYRNVIDRAAETQPKPALLAIETSGHSAWRDNNFVDDGCYTAARLLGKLVNERRKPGQERAGLLDLLGDELEEPKESIKVKLAVAGGLGAVPAAQEALCAALVACAEATPEWNMEPVNHDGLRCAVGTSGWLIARASLHEPLVSIQTESDNEGGTAAICAALVPFTGACEAAGVDISPLRDAAASA